MQAIRTDDVNLLVQQLDEKTTDINTVVEVSTGCTPLMLCCARGSVGCLKGLLSRGPDLQCEDKAGRTALHIACRRGRREVIGTLCEHMPARAFAELKEAKTNGGVTPAMCVVQSGDKSAFGECFFRGFSLYAVDNLGQSLEDYAQQLDEKTCQSMLGIIRASKRQLKTMASSEWLANHIKASKCPKTSAIFDEFRPADEDEERSS